jgi:hypothetical protein
VWPDRNTYRSALPFHIPGLDSRAETFVSMGITHLTVGCVFLQLSSFHCFVRVCYPVSNGSCKVVLLITIFQSELHFRASTVAAQVAREHLLGLTDAQCEEVLKQYGFFPGDTRQPTVESAPPKLAPTTASSGE